MVDVHSGFSLANSGGFAGGGAEAVCPPVGPGLAMHGQLAALFLFDPGKELLRSREAQPRPGVFLVPDLDEVAGGGGGGRIVGEIAGELDADAVERIVAVFERSQVVGHLWPDDPGVPLLDAPEVGGHIVVAAVGQHAFAGRGFPPEAGGLVEGQERAGLVDAHVEVANAHAVEVIRQAPAGAVDIVLHGRAHRDAEFFSDRAHGTDQGGEGILRGHFGHVQEQAANLDAPFADALPEPGDLGGGADAEVLAHGPGSLAGPAEAGVIRQAVGQVAVIEGVINVAQMFGEYLRLGPGVANVGVGVLGQIHCPLAGWGHGEGTEVAAQPARLDAHNDGSGASQRRNLDFDRVFAFGQGRDRLLYGLRPA